MRNSVTFWVLLVAMGCLPAPAFAQFNLIIQSADYSPFSIVSKGQVVESNDNGFLLLAPLQPKLYALELKSAKVENILFEIEPASDMQYILQVEDTGDWVLKGVNFPALIRGKRKAEQVPIASPYAGLAMESNPYILALGTLTLDSLLLFGGRSKIVASQTATAVNPIVTSAATSNNVITNNTQPAVVVAPPIPTDKVVLNYERVGANGTFRMIERIDADSWQAVFTTAGPDGTDTVSAFIKDEPLQAKTGIILPDANIQQEVKISPIAAEKETVAIVPAVPDSNVASIPMVEVGENRSSVAAADTSQIIKASPPVLELPLVEAAKKDSLASPVAATDEASNGAADSLKFTLTERVAMINSDCKQMVDEADWVKWRKKLANLNDVTAQLSTLQKWMKGKCVTASQARVMAQLFLNDEDRFAWLQQVYPAVSDTDQFPEMVDLLIGADAITRFKQMIHK